MRNGDANTGRRGMFHPSTAHVTPSMGLMGRIPASDRLHHVTERNWKLRVGAVRDKGTRPMHAFRTFLGDDEDFSNLSGGLS